MSNFQPNPPLVSVIVPAYNGARYLREALASVHAQTYRSFEIIVVDDGSTDETAAIAQADEQVRYFYQDNAGCGPARNAGVGHARGQFVSFLDHDDLWTRDKLTRQMAAWNALPPSDAPTFIFAHAQQFFSPELSEESRARVRLSDAPQAATVASVMLTTLTDFHRVGPYVREMPDFEWFLRARDGGARIHTLPDLVYHRRVHDANFGRTNQHRRNEYIHALKASLDRKRAAQ